MNYDFSLVLPMQNQAEIAESVTTKIIKVLNQNKINYELIMVENGSTDATLVVLKKMARKDQRIHVAVSKPGYGRAVIHGLKLARGKYLSYMPSDGQCDAGVLSQVIKSITQPGVDLVKVYRTSRESALRKFVSGGFNLLANQIFNLNTIDINASPTAFPAKNLKRLKLESPDSFLDTELLIKAKKLNWRIVRLPMKNFNRIGGRSTVKPTIVFEFLKNMIHWRFCGKL